MSSLVQRLLDRKLFFQNGGIWLMSPEPDSDCQLAATEIERLRLENQGWQGKQQLDRREIERLQAVIINSDAWKAPCPVCNYNGPGWYQPNQHPCAAIRGAAEPVTYEEAITEIKRLRTELQMQRDALRHAAAWHTGVRAPPSGP